MSSQHLGSYALSQIDLGGWSSWNHRGEDASLKIIPERILSKPWAHDLILLKI